MEKPWGPGTPEDGPITSLSAPGGGEAIPQYGIAECHLLLHGAVLVTILCWQGPCLWVPAPFLFPQVPVGAETPPGLWDRLGNSSQTP